MQWKPIANKYRKGKMKNTLQAIVSFFFLEFIFLINFKLKNKHNCSGGSEKESEIA